ncbi:hypothetical protein GYA28_02050 [Candidatus Roizmanbacteria bacterium]|jgi:hypothetical protein|nr:hypothetical protein [Candidatus Roizmanbacteria bacterium]
MKNLGLFFLALGTALLIFVVYNFVREKNNLKTPVPIEEGVKVIFVSPTK